MGRLQFSRFTLFAVLALCGGTVAFASPATPATSLPSPFFGLLQTSLALIFVLAIIAALAWLLRRSMHGQLFQQRTTLKVIANLAVGSREKVVIVETEQSRLVLGVTAHHITLLERQDRSAEDPVEAPPLSDDRAGSFAERLRVALRIQRHTDSSRS